MVGLMGKRYQNAYITPSSPIQSLYVYLVSGTARPFCIGTRMIAFTFVLYVCKGSLIEPSLESDSNLPIDLEGLEIAI